MSNFQRTIMADIGRAKQLWLSALFLAREAIYTQSAVMCHVPAEGRFLFFFFWCACVIPAGLTSGTKCLPQN